MQGSGYLCELWDELPIIPCKSQETLDLSYISWGMTFLDGFYFTFISGYSLGRNDMPQVGNLLSEQLTFIWVWALTQPVPVSGMWHPVSQGGLLDFLKRWQHHLNRWCTSWGLNPPGTSPLTAERLQGCCLIQRAFDHILRNPMALWWTQSVACSPHPSWPASSQTSGQVRRTIVIPASYQGSHQCGAANRNPSQSSCSASQGQCKTSGLHPFSDQDYCASPWTLWLPDGTNIQLFLEMGLHIFVHMQGYTLVMHLERCHICQLKLVLDQVCLAQVQVTAGK